MYIGFGDPLGTREHCQIKEHMQTYLLNHCTEPSQGFQVMAIMNMDFHN